MFHENKTLVRRPGHPNREWAGMIVNAESTARPRSRKLYSTGNGLRESHPSLTRLAQRIAACSSMLHRASASSALSRAPPRHMAFDDL